MTVLTLDSFGIAHLQANNVWGQVCHSDIRVMGHGDIVTLAVDETNEECCL